MDNIYISEFDLKNTIFWAVMEENDSVGSSPTVLSSPNAESSSRCSSLPSTPKSSQSSAVLNNPQTPQSDKSRSCWVIQPYKVGNAFSFEIEVKNQRGKAGPLSVCKPAAKYRPSFGSVIKVETVSKLSKKTGETIKLFEVTNENHLAYPLRQDLLFMFLKSKDPFTQKCQGLISDGKLDLLANYLSRCSRRRCSLQMV